MTQTGYRAFGICGIGSVGRRKRVALTPLGNQGGAIPFTAHPDGGLGRSAFAPLMGASGSAPRLRTAHLTRSDHADEIRVSTTLWNVQRDKSVIKIPSGPSQ